MAVVIEIARSDRFPTRPGIGADHSTADPVRPVHFPDRGLTVRVLPQDVRMAIVIEIAGSDRFPTRPRIGGNHSTANSVRPVPFPNRGLTVSVLPQNVGMTIAVEVGRDWWCNSSCDAHRG